MSSQSNVQSAEALTKPCRQGLAELREKLDSSLNQTCNHKSGKGKSKPQNTYAFGEQLVLTYFKGTRYALVEFLDETQTSERSRDRRMYGLVTKISTQTLLPFLGHIVQFCAPEGFLSYLDNFKLANVSPESIKWE